MMDYWFFLYFKYSICITENIIFFLWNRWKLVDMFVFYKENLLVDYRLKKKLCIHTKYIDWILQSCIYGRAHVCQTTGVISHNIQISISIRKLFLIDFLKNLRIYIYLLYWLHQKLVWMLHLMKNERRQDGEMSPHYIPFIIAGSCIYHMLRKKI